MRRRWDVVAGQRENHPAEDSNRHQCRHYAQPVCARLPGGHAQFSFYDGQNSHEGLRIAIAGSGGGFVTRTGPMARAAFSRRRFSNCRRAVTMKATCTTAEATATISEAVQNGHFAMPRVNMSIP